jgi:(p)ppGpp synthase/HD superfamily hydrolase
MKMNKMNNTIVSQAIVFGAIAHAGQLDDAGKDYFMTHCWQVYEIVRILYPDDFELQAAALLHDILEDSDVTYETLASEFGIDVANLIHEVTHERRADDSGWYFPHLHSIRGIVLKFADRASNLSRMEGVWDTKHIEKYLKKSKFWQSEDMQADNFS